MRASNVWRVRRHRLEYRLCGWNINGENSKVYRILIAIYLPNFGARFHLLVLEFRQAPKFGGLDNTSAKTHFAEPRWCENRWEILKASYHMSISIYPPSFEPKIHRIVLEFEGISVADSSRLDFAWKLAKSSLGLMRALVLIAQVCSLLTVQNCKHR